MKKLNLYPLKASISKGEVILQKKKGQIVCRMDGETAVKLGLEISSTGEKALKQCGEVFDE